MTRRPAEDKPPYRIPSMIEIAALPSNGLRVVSTFSGCGGSCLGFRMAGYRVVWANEADPQARPSYAANFPDVAVDPRDVRQVTPEEILAACGLARGELDVLEGSPPCVSFSTAGQQARSWGVVREHAGIRQRTDDLFAEYLRLLDGLRPRAFVAEKVSGMARGVSKGQFVEVLLAMRGLGYAAECRLLDAQWLGVPQVRKRVIFIGIRSDLSRRPAFPAPLPWRYTVRDALPWISETGAAPHGPRSWENRIGINGPAPSVSASGPDAASYYKHYVVEDTAGWNRDRNVTDAPAPTIRAAGAHHFFVTAGAPVVDRRVRLISRAHGKRGCPMDPRRPRRR